MPSATEIRIAHDGSRACFQVRGRGDFRCSDVLRAAVRHLRESGCDTFAFDLAECPAMDSTFIGVIAGPLRRLPGTPNGDRACRVVVCRAGERLRETLEEMGIAPLMEFTDDFAAPAELAPTESHAADRADLARTSIEAHETLISLNPEQNAARFRDVVAYLREEAGGKADG